MRRFVLAVLLLCVTTNAHAICLLPYGSYPGALFFSERLLTYPDGQKIAGDINAVKGCIPTVPTYAGSTGQPGYQNLPGGEVLQWGAVNIANGTASATASFSIACATQIDSFSTGGTFNSVVYDSSSTLSSITWTMPANCTFVGGCNFAWMVLCH